jgi:hypothetical protein
MSKLRNITASLRSLATAQGARAVSKPEGNFSLEYDKRERRADGGKVDKRDYPAKKLNRMEKALARAQKALAEETKPIMSLDDNHVAQALHIAKEK